MPSDTANCLPSFDEILARDPGWLDAAVPAAEASRIVGLSASTLATLRCRGGGPPYVVLNNRTVRYRRRDLFEWVGADLRASTSDPGGAGRELRVVT